jgi:hypothetical protein
MTDQETPSRRSQTLARLKSAGIIVATLIIGMVLGGLLTARIVQNRIDDVAALRSQKRFTRFIERSIEFENEDQRRQVSAILDTTADRMFEHLRSSRQEARTILDSARSQLGEVLSEQQMEQLEKRLHHRRGKRPPGPAFEGPPPPHRRRR